jgi:hypothetical protein
MAHEYCQAQNQPVTPQMHEQKSLQRTHAVGKLDSHIVNLVPFSEFRNSTASSRTLPGMHEFDTNAIENTHMQSDKLPYVRAPIKTNGMHE